MKQEISELSSIEDWGMRTLLWLFSIVLLPIFIISLPFYYLGKWIEGKIRNDNRY